jgi:hypothetical protein
MFSRFRPEAAPSRQDDQSGHVETKMRRVCAYRISDELERAYAEKWWPDLEVFIEESILGSCLRRSLF